MLLAINSSVRITNTDGVERFAAGTAIADDLGGFRLGYGGDRNHDLGDGGLRFFWAHFVVGGAAGAGPLAVPPPSSLHSFTLDSISYTSRRLS